MELVNKKPLIIILSGKSRSGKTKSANIIKEIYEKENKRAIVISYASYLKEYAKNILNWDLSEENKPRTFLQELGVDLIKNKIDNNMLINRIIEDIKVYSYFYDVIVISDARFIEEIENIKNIFSNVVSINIQGKANSLSNKNHITETALSNYDNYDYIINNDGKLEKLYDKIINILKGI